MQKLSVVAAGVALSLLSSVSLADTWEPGLGVRLNYAPLSEIEGQSGNSMDGSLFGIETRYASSNETPITFGISYQGGSSDHSGSSNFSSATAKTRVFHTDVAVGKVFHPGQAELIPYVGLGFRQMTQKFSASSYAADNDIVTPERTHRHLYMPIGLYLGTASPIDHFDFYLSTEYRQVLMGEVSLEARGGSTMNSNSGKGFRTEAGIHFPSQKTFNLYTGLYFEQWDIKSPDTTYTNVGGVVSIESEPKTKQTSAGVTIGLQF